MNKLLSPTILLCAVVLAVLSCNQPVSETAPSSNGLWRQIGYGRILEIEDSVITVYDLNDIDCMLTFSEHILDFAAIGEYNKDTLTLIHGIDHWKCKRIEKLPEMCASRDQKDPNDPLYNFDVFWQNFDEHYCSFDLKGVDWDAVRQQYRPQITDQTTELELFMILEEIMNSLEDGHIKMDVPESIEEDYEAASETTPLKYNFPDEVQLSKEIAELYVDSLVEINAGMSRYGMISEDVAYLQVNFMMMQADYDLDPTLGLQDFVEQYWAIAGSQKDEIHREDEANGMGSTLDRVLSELPNARTFVIDLRFNIGGKDGVAMEIINHFSSYEGEMARKYVKEKDQFVAHQSIKNDPSSGHFDGAVYLLTSHRTASASELAVLCSMADEQFLRIGSNTEGVFSSTLDKELPNGWAYEFSNEIYEDLDGKNYEHVGIAPDIEIDYSFDSDLFFDQLQLAIDTGKDPAIEEALREHFSSKNAQH